MTRTNYRRIKQILRKWHFESSQTPSAISRLNGEEAALKN